MFAYNLAMFSVKARRMMMCTSLISVKFQNLYGYILILGISAAVSFSSYKSTPPRSNFTRILNLSVYPIDTYFKSTSGQQDSKTYFYLFIFRIKRGTKAGPRLTHFLDFHSSVNLTN